MPVKKTDVKVQLCTNQEADRIFLKNYWLKRIRRSRRLSYTVYYINEKVAWIQVAEPFGTKIKKPLDIFNIQETVEICRGYFIDDAPINIESCVISKIVRYIPNDWCKHFNIIKKLVIIYQDVDVNQKGIVYKASNFKSYGYCVRARHYSTPTRGNNSNGKKIIWARGLKPVSGQHYKVLLPNLDS